MGKIIIEITELEDGRKEMSANIKMKQSDIIKATRSLVKECEKLTGASWAIIDAMEEISTTVIETERKES